MNIYIESKTKETKKTFDAFISNWPKINILAPVHCYY